MHSEGKPMTGHMEIEIAKSFYDEIKITEMCTFSKGWLQNLGTV